MTDPAGLFWSPVSPVKLARRTITAHGKTMTIKEWAAETGLAYSTIRERLKKGWVDDRAVGPRAAKYRPRTLSDTAEPTTHQWRRIAAVMVDGRMMTASFGAAVKTAQPERIIRFLVGRGLVTEADGTLRMTTNGRGFFATSWEFRK